MKKDKLRGAIVGCGEVAAVAHLPAWRHIRHVELVAACDQVKEAAAKTARRWGIHSAYDSFSQMLESESLDFVDICTPPPTHYPLSMQAMQAGLHVLMEKPMAIKLSEADEMVTAVQKHGVKLCVAHNFLFTPVIQAARSLVASGAIGDLLAVEGHDLLSANKVLPKENHWSHNLPGGIFGEHSPHMIYLGSTFLGRINSVRAMAKKYSKYPWVKADELKVMVEGENCMGFFTNSCNSSKFSFTLDIYGTKGKLHLDNVTQTMTRSLSGSNRTYALVLGQLDLAVQSLAGAAYISVQSLLRQKWYTIGHRVLFQKFIESIRDGTDSPVTGEDGRENVRILQEVWKQIS